MSEPTTTPIEPTAEDVLHSLNLPADLTWPALLDIVSQATGRPVQFLRLSGPDWDKLRGDNAVTGFSFTAANTTFIAVRESDPPLRRAHVCAHELAHIAAKDPGIVIDQEQADRFLDAVDSITSRTEDNTEVENVFARGMCDSDRTAESRAERIAYEFAKRLYRSDPRLSDVVFG